MKVEALIAMLSKLPQDAEVIMSKDAEGNKFCPLADISLGRVRPQDIGQHYIDDFYCDSHSDDDCGLDPGERETLTKVICIWP